MRTYALFLLFTVILTELFTPTTLTAVQPEVVDEIDRIMANSQKVLAQSNQVIAVAQKATEKKTEEVVSAVEETIEVAVEMTEKAEELEVEVADTKQEVEVMKEVTTEVTKKMRTDSSFAKAVMVTGFDQVIESRTKIKIMDRKIEQALVDGNDSIVEEMLQIKRFYELNGIQL